MPDVPDSARNVPDSAPDPVDRTEPAARRRRLEAVVRGRVQGVGFRMFAFDAALALRLVGWVANEPDGSVRAVVEGPEADVLHFLRALREGPPASRVDDVTERWLPPTDAFERFSVRSGWHAGD
jgi:acylphosphatase